jgi:hypothetical protein
VRAFASGAVYGKDSVRMGRGGIGFGSAERFCRIRVLLFRRVITSVV